jgi:hypothetical protein
MQINEATKTLHDLLESLPESSVRALLGARGTEALYLVVRTPRVVTCVYCGHEYPTGTPTSQNASLTEHIRGCAKHPMRRVELERDEALRDAVCAELGRRRCVDPGTQADERSVADEMYDDETVKRIFT